MRICYAAPRRNATYQSISRSPGRRSDLGGRQVAVVGEFFRETQHIAIGIGHLELGQSIKHSFEATGDGLASGEFGIHLTQPSPRESQVDIPSIGAWTRPQTGRSPAQHDFRTAMPQNRKLKRGDCGNGSAMNPSTSRYQAMFSATSVTSRTGMA